MFVSGEQKVNSPREEPEPEIFQISTPHPGPLPDQGGEGGFNRLKAGQHAWFFKDRYEYAIHARSFAGKLESLLQDAGFRAALIDDTESALDVNWRIAQLRIHG